MTNDASTGPVTLQVEHLTRYEYAKPARSSFNEARLRPRSETRPGVRQELLDHSLRVVPPSFTSEYTDYFGTHVVSFEVQRPHTVLEITATSQVRLTPVAPPPATSIGWATVRSRPTVERFCEELEISEVVAPPAELARAAEHAVVGKDPAAAASAVMAVVSGRLRYRPGSTGVHSTADEAWRQAQGVCQDYAQLSVGALRSVGIPARYVSGYLMPAPCEPGETVEGQSHAWVEFWAGRWHGFDPTNDTAPGAAHIVVGRGREYRDVRPVYGVVSSGVGGDLTVAVRFTRLD